MGYTRYWNRTEKPITTDFVLAVCAIIAECNDKGIMIRNGWGGGNPVVTMETIAINGDDSTNLSHETCYFDNVNKGFDFCKTARKPYDYAVRKILEVAEIEGLITDVRSDGENNEIISDEDFIRKYSSDTKVYKRGY